MPKELTRLDHCLNCGSPTGNNYCSQCGQENEDRTTSLNPLFSDFFAEVLSFDSKLVRTIVMLVRHPGRLTNEYNAGRRVHYLSPLKMYLVFTGIFFLAMSFQVNLDFAKPFTPPVTEAPKGKQAVKPKPALQNSQAAAKPSEEEELAAAARDLGTINPMGISINKGGVTAFGKKLPRTLEEYDTQQRALPENERDKGLGHFMSRQALKLSNDPSTLLRSLIFDSIPKIMFVLLPVVSGVLWLLYIRSKRYYVEHLIFALHCQSFTFTAMAAMTLVPFEFIELTIPFIVAGYLLVAMKVVYKQSWWKTVIKWTSLGMVYFFLLTMGIVAAAMLSLVTF